ncbi:PH domain-containing protein [Rossellomorea marisflavi]|uniref:PH domain-containing protein n=1 Tax=Rossellomorea marisflavi TaxID=189381 RepID=UPI0027A1B3F2|nr:PH domain-containing protein [Rossellomorea marisflavi]UTE72138.1 PH domain-containing protein [Rossellomorea marisflavi]
MKYPSKQDWWIILLAWIPMVATIGLGLFTMVEKASTLSEQILVFTSCIVVPLFFLWMMITTYYLIEEETLVIRFGPFKKSVPLASITSIRKTRNPMSSPALSLKRIEILYNRYDMVLISPKDRDAFIQVLSERCEQLTS